MPKLTIVSPNKNRLDFNQKSTQWFFNSLQWQSSCDFEVIIVDGGSNNYNDLKKHFDLNFKENIKLFSYPIGEIFEKCKLNNVGIRSAKTDYILTTDVDLIYHPDFVSTVLDKIQPNMFLESKTMYLKSKALEPLYNNKIDPKNNFDLIKRGRLKAKTTCGGCQCSHIKNWEKVHGYDENYLGWGSEDQDLLKRMNMAGVKVKWIGENFESVMIFHQPHHKNTKMDLICQEKNKKILNNVKCYQANPNGWGGSYNVNN